MIDVTDPAVEGQRIYFKSRYGDEYPEVGRKFDELVRLASTNGGGKINLADAISEAEKAARQHRAEVCRVVQELHERVRQREIAVSSS